MSSHKYYCPCITWVFNLSEGLARGVTVTGKISNAHQLWVKTVILGRIQLEKTYIWESGGLTYILGPATEFVYDCNFSASQDIKWVNNIYWVLCKMEKHCFAVKNIQVTSWWLCCICCEKFLNYILMKYFWEKTAFLVLLLSFCHWDSKSRFHPQTHIHPYIFIPLLKLFKAFLSFEKLLRSKLKLKKTPIIQKSFRVELGGKKPKVYN